MPRENSPAYEPEIDSARPARITASDEECDCCAGHGILGSQGYYVDSMGFVLCQRCVQGRCPNCN